MNGPEARGDLLRQANGEEGRKRESRAQPVAQRFTGDELHRVKRIGGVLIEEDDIGDIGVMHARRRARLAHKQRLDPRVAELGRIDDFQRHLDPQLRIKCLVRHPHCPAPKFQRGAINAPTHLIVREVKRLVVHLKSLDRPRQLAGSLSAAYGMLGSPSRRQSSTQRGSPRRSWKCQSCTITVSPSSRWRYARSSQANALSTSPR